MTIRQLYSVLDVVIKNTSTGRSSRNKGKQQNTVNFALMANIHSIYEPQTYTEAKGIPEWEQAMDAEYQSLLKNNTRVLSDLPPGKKPISCKWVYKVKYHADGTLDKYKARLVARGFTQRKGIYYEDCSYCQDEYHSSSSRYCSSVSMESPSDGC